jgi:hypothetical protein
MARSPRLLALATLVLVGGCADSIVREVGPENDPTVVNSPEVFEFSATDLRNVNDEVTFLWPNSSAQATIHHDTFTHHGYAILVIEDAEGVVVDSTILQLDLETETRAGTPGEWTIKLQLAGARGRAAFTIRPKP